MAIDAPTMLLLTLAIAVIAAALLAHEAHATRDAALARWSAGFGAIVLGCSITPLRQAVSPILGVWVANGLLVVAHMLFLNGMGRFTQSRVAAVWWLALLPWWLMLLVPVDAAHSGLFGLVNSCLVGGLALATARLALRAGRHDLPARRLGLVFLLHGLFYALKTALVFAPGAFVDITRLKGLLIQISLFEGILVEVGLALLMVAAVRRRREDEAAALAGRDPLTGVFNRRAFREPALAMLRASSAGRQPGALMLLDVDHFKSVNDTAGHAAGDRLLVALAAVLAARMPQGALVARLGGDEFVMMAPDLDAVELAVVAQAMRADFKAAGAAFLPADLVATLSMGAAPMAGAEDLDVVLDRADAALYEAKRRGRDRLVGAPAALGTAPPPPNRGDPYLASSAG